MHYFHITCYAKDHQFHCFKETSSSKPVRLPDPLPGPRPCTPLGDFVPIDLCVESKNSLNYTMRLSFKQARTKSCNVRPVIWRPTLAKVGLFAVLSKISTCAFCHECHWKSRPQFDCERQILYIVLRMILTVARKKCMKTQQNCTRSSSCRREKSAAAIMSD